MPTAVTPTSPKPWWREPWPWILMAGPFVAMVACIATMVLAAQGFDAQTIRDGGRKQGLVVSKPVALTAQDAGAMPHADTADQVRRQP